MIKGLLTLLLTLSAALYAEVSNITTDAEFVAKKIPIVDIRTAPEWRDTGVLKDAILITFFDENRNYDIDKFVKELNSELNTSKEFALICRSGARSALVAKMLSQKYNYNVINLVGGMRHVATTDLQTKSYK